MKKIERKETLKRFGIRLRQLRECAEVSQDQIQYATGITQPHISAIEAGSITIGLEHLSVLAEFFGLEDYQILQYKEPVPVFEELKKNIIKFLRRNDIDPAIFIKRGLSNTLKNQVLPSKFLATPRYAAEIANFINEKYESDFSTTAVSQALENLRKKGLIIKLPTEKKSKFQYRKK